MVHRYAHVLIVLAAACDDSPAVVDDESYRIEMPPVDLAPAEESIACSYHVFPDLPAIERVSFFGTSPVHSLSIHIEPVARVGGALIDNACEVSDQAVTLLSYRRQIGELAFPADAPLELPAGVGVIIDVHFLNPSDEPMTSNVFVDFHPATAPASMSSGLLGATRMNFAVPLGSSIQETRCRVPEAVHVAGIYPNARRLTYENAIRDNSGELASTYDWEHPSRATFDPAHVPDGDLIARCSFVNTSGPVGEGGPMIDDERCGMSLLVVPGSGVESCYVP